MKTVKTWLPVFPGFYGTWYEPDETNEQDGINQGRADNNLPELKWDEIEFDYTSYQNEVGENACSVMQNDLENFLSKIEFENIQSPREYNFTNDSINCIIHLSLENETAITEFLNDHKDQFSEYLKNEYTSYDGFLSHYVSDISDWIPPDLDHSHNLGAVLQFIWYQVKHEDGYNKYQAEEVFCSEVLEDCYLSAVNYDQYTTMIHCPECGCWEYPRDAIGTICKDCFELEKHSGDRIVCCDCLTEITNPWIKRQFQFRIKHGFIKYNRVKCDICELLTLKTA